MNKPNALEQHTGKYWLLSSYWNQRVDIEEEYTCSQMMRVVQNLASCIKHFRLYKAVAALLWEVILHGRKPEVAEKENTVVELKLRQHNIHDDAQLAFYEEGMKQFTAEQG